MKLFLLSSAALMGLAASPAFAQAPHSAHDMSAMASSAATGGAAEDAAVSAGMDTGAHDMAAMDHAGMTGMDHQMASALGSYPATRDASGTAWQPDLSTHEGIHVMRGPWMIMGHATLNGVYSWQNGPRGDEKGFASGMAMLSARRDLANQDSVNLRAMLSPDPFMGKGGYPLLLQTGETADGETALVDRQHPHDLFMELSASYSHRVSERDSLFLYAGLPGEPAFGPPAFMHRMSISDSPEAPISHHWLDSTHVTFGVVTLGWVHDAFKLEASRFKGREPDQNRFDIETPKLDSTAVRASWNPNAAWSLQASWADVKSPEALQPLDDQIRWSLSAIRTVRLGDEGSWSTTAAWGRRSAAHGKQLDAHLVETAVKPNARWTVFARAERTENNELLMTGGHHHGAIYTVGKVSVGAIRDWRIAEHLTLGFGALYAVNFVPDALEASYDGDPTGGMAFIRLKIS